MILCCCFSLYPAITPALPRLTILYIAIDQRQHSIELYANVAMPFLFIYFLCYCCCYISILASSICLRLRNCKIEILLGGRRRRKSKEYQGRVYCMFRFVTRLQKKVRIIIEKSSFEWINYIQGALIIRKTDWYR